MHYIYLIFCFTLWLTLRVWELINMIFCFFFVIHLFLDFELLWLTLCWTDTSLNFSFTYFLNRVKKYRHALLIMTFSKDVIFLPIFRCFLSLFVAYFNSTYIFAMLFFISADAIQPPALWFIVFGFYIDESFFILLFIM